MVALAVKIVGTHLVLDETAMEPGQLDPNGMIVLPIFCFY